MVRLFFLLLVLFTFAFAGVNINKANEAQLQTINGIGPVKAKEIVKYRKTHGGFKNVSELENVKGIGPKTLSKIKKQVSVR